MINTGAKKAAEDVRDLEAEIKKLEDSLRDVKKGSEEWLNITNQITDARKRNTTATNTNTTAHNNSLNAINREIQALQAENRNLDINSEKFKANSAAIAQHANRMNQATKATGAGTSATMEFGRIISDAPYGIRGMANNISQFTSQMFYASQAAGGLGKAIKQMLSAMMGPLGIVIAITAVVSALDFFAGSTKKAKDETDDLNESLERQIEILDRANESISGTGGTWLDKFLGDNWEKDLKILKNEFSDFKKKVESLSESEQGDKKVVGELIDKYTDLLTVRKKISESEQRSKELKEELKDAGAAEVGILKERLEGERASRYNLLNRKADLEAIFKVESKEKGREKGKVKDFALSQSKIENILRKSLQKQDLLRSDNNKEKLLIENQNQEDDLLNTYNLEREKNKIKLDAYLNGKASPAQKAEAQRIYDENEINATKLHEAALESIHNEGSLREAEFDKNLKDKLRQGQLKAELDSLDSHLDVMSELLNDKDPKSLEVLQEKQRAVWEKEDELFEQDLVRTAEKMDKEGANALEIEDRINELKFEQSQNRAAAELQLEVDTIEAKKSVQQEYFSYLSGLGSVLTELGKKNKALAIAGLAMEKGAAIANIVIEASKSNATQTAADAVFASVTNAKYAAVPIGGQALAASEILANQAVSAKLRAKTNIRAGLSIAKIAATTITSGSLGSGGGGGGSATGSSATVSPSFAPNFNVVGNSNENQLAQSISNQTNSPVQAYVVYEDIAEAESVTQQSIESSGI